MEEVQISSAAERTLSDAGTSELSHFVNTAFRFVAVSVCGDLSRPVIITYHDLGLNHVTNFQAFFNHPTMQDVVNHFCIVHLNAPGQEKDAQTISHIPRYPSIQELSESIAVVKRELNIGLLQVLVWDLGRMF
ncbi:hypothetical protein Pmani_034852 [Petrolisthes manimaculis]|uniref:Protein NDRG3 n=1 Tax=Petrolisthes manimaculis TaxID=1843537 RepID=A0AAE1NNJ5_9EUCA|nr:hypothetical protein Pmani_034852 [Petrolisthes manimaculis]